MGLVAEIVGSVESNATTEPTPASADLAVLPNLQQATETLSCLSAMHKHPMMLPCRPDPNKMTIRGILALFPPPIPLKDSPERTSR